jgi:hypothetical protein
MNLNNNNNPDRNQPEDEGVSWDEVSNFMAGFTQQFIAQVEQQLTGGLNIAPDTLAGQLRLGLIEQRTQELTERYLQPDHISRMTAVLSQGVGELFKLMSDQDEQEGNGADSDLPAEGPITSTSVIAQMIASREFAAMTARQAAVDEYRTLAERESRRSESFENLQDQGIATGAIEKLVKKNRDEGPSYDDFRDTVFAKLLLVAETDGLEVALKPETRNQIIQGMMSRDEYLAMRLAILERMGEVLDGFQDAGRLAGGDQGRVVEAMAAAMTDNGQLERLESQAICDIVLDARAIYGS